MRKQASTNTLNKIEIDTYCGMSYTIGLIGGRWKANILWRLIFHGRLRYSAFLRLMPHISERALVSQLRELEADGLVRRIVYPEVPPRVEYELTDLGRSMQPMMQAMCDWGRKHKTEHLHEDQEPDTDCEKLKAEQAGRD